MYLKLLKFICPIVLSSSVLKAEYRVVPVYFSSKDETSAVSRDYIQRYQTMVTLTQIYFADELERLGHGRRSFKVRRGQYSGPKISVIKGKENSDYYGTDLQGGQPGYDSYKIYDRLKNEIIPKLGFLGRSDVIVMVICKNCPWLGAPGFGVIGTVDPSFEADHGLDLTEQHQIFCDQTIPHESGLEGTGWWEATRAALSSGRVGGFIHELGHSFGAPHTEDWSLMGSGGHFAIGRHFAPECSSEPQSPPLGGSSSIYASSLFFSNKYPSPKLVISNEQVSIASTFTKKCLSTVGGVLTQQTCDDSPSQKFFVDKFSRKLNTFNIKSATDPDQCIAKLNGSFVMWLCDPGQHFQFQLLSTRENAYMFQNQSGKNCLTVPGGNSSDNQEYVEWECARHQSFEIK